MNLFAAVAATLTNQNAISIVGDAFKQNLPIKRAGSRMLLSETSGSATPGTSVRSTKPILQLNSFPVTIDPDNYKNPLSTANPLGSLATLWAFRQLVDPVPDMTRYYNPSMLSTEQTYSMIVQSASVSGNNPFAQNVVASAQKILTQIRNANMDGSPGTWAPVYATPGDWYDTSNGRYRPLNFDLNSVGSADSPFMVLGGTDSPTELQIHSEDGLRSTQQLAPSTQIRQIATRYLQVELARPWFNGTLFSTDGWVLSGQERGFCSTGNPSGNTGVLPLLPTSLLLVTDVTVDAAWNISDRKVIDNAHNRGDSVTLGPFVLPPDAGAKKAVIQVLGWVTSLVPLSPRLPL